MRKSNGKRILFREDRYEPIPLYHQIKSILRKKIISKELNPGEKLPTQKELGEQYRVSRITILQALGDLEKEGFIVTKRGKGSFVSYNTFDFPAPKLTGSMFDLIDRSHKLQTKIINFNWERVSREITNYLNLPVNTEVLCIERLRTNEGKPFSYILNYLPPEVGQKIDAETLVDKTLLPILNEDLGIKLTEAKAKVEADIAELPISTLLEIQAGAPILKVERITYDSSHKAVEYVKTIYRGDSFYLTINWNNNEH